jgi:hypothetical protein
MAGGIFSGYPFEPNMKCVIFTALLAGGYWFLPTKNKIVLFTLLIVPYIAMAWYDYSYKCTNKLKPTIIPFGRMLFLPLKPKEYKDQFASLPPEALRDMDTLDHIVTWILLITGSAYVLYHT